LTAERLSAAEAAVAVAPAERPLPAWKRPFQALEFADFRHLWISTLPGTTAMQMGITARGYLAYDISGSAAAVGFVSLGAALPMLVLGLLGGVAADRFHKRNVLLFTQSLQATAATANAVLVLTGIVQIWQLTLVAVLTGIGMAFNMPARQSFVAQLVPRERVVNAIALHMAGMNFARIVGPAIAGGLIAIPFIGVGGAFVVIALMFSSVIFNLLRIRNSGPPETQAHVSPLRSIADGLSYVRGSPVVVILLTLAFIPMFLGNPYQHMMPVFADDVFGVGPAGLGFLMAASGAGALIGSLAIASSTGFARRGLLQMTLGMAFGGGLAVFAFSPAYSVGLVTILFVGAASAGYQALNNTLVMHSADPAYRGRVMSLFHLTNGASPLALVPVGFLADAYGAPVVIGVGGLLLLALVFMVGMFHPAYRRIG
jgi:MFS family permease